MLVVATVANAEPVPDWVTKPPVSQTQVCGMGSAALEQQNQPALSLAAQRARVEVVQTLRTSVQASTSILSTQSNAADGQRTRADASKSVRQAATFDASVSDLPGLRIVETYTDQARRESYALACLDMEQASSAIQLRVDEIAAGLAGGASYSDLLNYQIKMMQLNELRGVLGVWLSEVVMQRMDQVKTVLNGALIAAKAKQTFMLSPSISASLADAVSTELTQRGFTASSKAPRFIMRIEEGGLQDSTEMGMYILRQSISLTIQDTVTDQAKTSQVFCKGIGTQLNQARTKLQMQCGADLGKAAQAILLP